MVVHLSICRALGTPLFVASSTRTNATVYILARGTEYMVTYQLPAAAIMHHLSLVYGAVGRYLYIYYVYTLTCTPPVSSRSQTRADTEKLREPGLWGKGQESSDSRHQSARHVREVHACYQLTLVGALERFEQLQQSKSLSNTCTYRIIRQDTSSRRCCCCCCLLPATRHLLPVACCPMGLPGDTPAQY